MHTSPGAKLEVAGEIKFSGEGLKTSALGKITPFYLRGTGLYNSSNRMLIIGSTTIYNKAEGRGLTLTVISKSNHTIVSTNTYDTYGDSTASDKVATALNGITKDQIGILTSFDAWEWRISDSLKAALRRMGLYKAAITPPSNYDAGGRRPYAAIFEASSAATVGTAKAVEVLYSNNSNAPYAEVRGWLVDGSFIATGSAPNALTDNLGANPVVTVSESGNVGIGTAEPGDLRLKVIGDSHIKGWLWVEGGLVFRDISGKEWVRALNSPSTYPMGGLPVSTTPSDLRLKTDLRPIRNALEKILQLHGKYYRWGKAGLEFFTRDIPDSLSAGPNATEEEIQRLWEKERQKAYDALSGSKIGLIAQDVEAIVPEVVSEDDKGYKYIYYQQLTALLVEAIKEQNELIQALSIKVAALEAV